MKTPSNANRLPVSFNMTPMIDVVFLLIIFFLVSSHLAQRESRIELTLPDAVSGEKTPIDDHARVVVSVRDTGEILIGGQRTLPGDLTRILGNAANENTEDLELRIRSDRQALYEHVQPILKAAVSVGIWNVTFAVIEKAS